MMAGGPWIGECRNEILKRNGILKFVGTNGATLGEGAVNNEKMSLSLSGNTYTLYKKGNSPGRGARQLRHSG